MIDRRGLQLPAFSESATEALLPIQPTGRSPLRVGQGADFRQPADEAAAGPALVRRALAAGVPAFSDPDRQI